MFGVVFGVQTASGNNGGALLRSNHRQPLPP